MLELYFFSQTKGVPLPQDRVKWCATVKFVLACTPRCFWNAASRSLKYHINAEHFLKCRLDPWTCYIMWSNNKRGPTHSMPWCHMTPWLLTRRSDMRAVLGPACRPLALHLYVLPPSLVSSSSEQINNPSVMVESPYKVVEATVVVWVCRCPRLAARANGLTSRWKVLWLQDRLGGGWIHTLFLRGWELIDKVSVNLPHPPTEHQLWPHRLHFWRWSMHVWPLRSIWTYSIHSSIHQFL